MCDACEAKAGELHGAAPEPAWSLIVHAAHDTCQACNVRDVAGICNQCPGVEMLRRLIAGSRNQEASDAR